MSWLLIGLWWMACSATGSPPPPAVDPRDQYVLLRQMMDAEQAKDLAAYRAVRDGWEGRRFRWEVQAVPQLCDDLDCNAIPFDSARFDGIVRQGWLPRLSFTEAERAALDAACAPHPRCVFVFEGRLASLRFTPQELTAVAFDEVRVVSARAAGPEESWGRRYVPGRGDLDPVVRRAEELRERGFAPTLSVRAAEGK
jgi:hypothetical protein